MLKFPFFQQCDRMEPKESPVGGAVASVVIVTRPFSPTKVAAQFADMTHFPVVLLAKEETLRDAVSLREQLPGESRVVLLDELEEDYYGVTGNLQGTNIAFNTGDSYIPVDEQPQTIDSFMLERIARELSICANCGVKRFNFRGDRFIASLSCAGALDALVNRHCGETCLISAGSPKGDTTHAWGVHLIMPRDDMEFEPAGLHTYIVAESGSEFTSRPGNGLPIVTSVAGLAFQASATTYFVENMELVRQLAQKAHRTPSESPRGLLFAVGLAVAMGTKQITCAQSLLEEDGQISQRVRNLTEQANVRLTVQQ